MRLAIVGSVHFVDPNAQRLAVRIMRAEMEMHEPEVCISGGADGIDTLFEEVAETYGYTRDNGRFIAHLPANRRWRPNGYQARNILIAEDCTRLVAIRCHASKTYGSGYTADYAERLGKEVRRVIL